jgi:hypothetical protein
MRRIHLICFILVSFCTVKIFAVSSINIEMLPALYVQDTIKDNQILYNGRIWRNIYSRVQEDQFLFSRDFLEGSLTIGGQTFKGVGLKYDIFKDELLTPVEDGVLQLNKEMIDSFSLTYNGREYRFIKQLEDSLAAAKSFFEILYDGKSSLYVKHLKKIDKMAVEGKYDKFYQVNKIYIVKENKFYPVVRKSDFMNVLEDKNIQVKDFVKKNKLRITEKVPETFIPVLMYYDNLIQ